MFKNKSVLITGGTGSFGGMLLKKLLQEKSDIAKIIIFSRDEKKQNDMRLKYNDPKIKFMLGDVRDRESVSDAMRGVNFVFHAAALKQVPSCEFFPMEAIKTNIIGSFNVIEEAVKYKVSRVICLGTDKAVYPINVMGMTKALMEKLIQAKARALKDSGTVVAAVRYGNVMCSRGSVIPLFIQQIKDRKPLTITDPNMTRFLLSLNDAIDLVLFAFINAKQGDTFIKKAPACTIIDLANTLKKIFQIDLTINTIGMRHSEKLHETLLTQEELCRSEDMGDYYRLNMDSRDLDYNKFYVEGNVTESSFQDYSSYNTYRVKLDELENLLLSLPEVKEALASKN